MTIKEIITQILTRAAGGVVDLKAELEKIKAEAPDTAPLVDPLIALLDTPVDVAGIATALVPEIGNIVVFKFDGREHPSDGF